MEKEKVLKGKQLLDSIQRHEQLILNIGKVKEDIRTLTVTDSNCLALPIGKEVKDKILNLLLATYEMRLAEDNKELKEL